MSERTPRGWEVTMQLGLVAVVVFLSFMDYSNSLKDSKGRRQRRISTEVPPSCTRGCELCSEYNGCLKCMPKLFILLERNDIRQIGVCLASCPVGYFGVRNPDMNKCNKCRIENCEDCFSRNFCTKCKEGLYAHKGRCYPSCPDGFSLTNGTTECTSVAQCELGEWGSWGPCMKKNKTCGFKKGTQTRAREPVQSPSPDTSASPAAPLTCTPEAESRKCTVQRKVPCNKGEKGKNRNEKPEDQRNKENGKNRNREAKDGIKRRKFQNRATTAPTLTPSGSK
ncbi:R-spondin-1 [Scleropages formosus]|uniref:R-spondin 1 n=1 Tax=Scleropages formosus TaxID=113540 RepID=A0A8C9SCE3_SCLFO|nr:R-spondin-1 [Scleropages formosus]XP_018582547.1 R-spondin-1 [Scleropages formosus]